MSKHSGFFCVSPEHVALLTEEGAEAFCAYLVLSCGTGGNNSTTAWSAQAVAKYCGCRWATANKAIEKLLALGIITKDQERSTPKGPKYRIADNSPALDDRIWLPKSLVEGVTGASPYPLQALRESDDPLLIRMLMDLYQSHKLIDAGGIDPEKICAKFEGEILGEQGANKAWGFKSSTATAWAALHEIHLEDHLPKPFKTFWERFQLLCSLGFVTRTHVLMNKEGGDPLLSIGDTAEESETYKVLSAAAYGLCTSRQLTKSSHSVVLPVPAHIKEPVLIGIYRMKYRPHTKATAVWWQQVTSMNQAYMARMEGLKPATVLEEEPF